MQVHLQGIGKRNAIPASELKVGDVMLCNFGETQRFTKLERSKTGKTINYEVESTSGKRYKGRTTPSRLIAVQRVNKRRK